MKVPKRSVVTFAVVAIAAGLGAATFALAFDDDPILGEGTRIDAVKTAKGGTHLHPFTITNDQASLPGAEHRLTLRRTSLVLARFTATTECTGGGGGRCDVFIGADADDDPDFLGELSSASFDSDGEDRAESHAVDGSITLPPGGYRFWVNLDATDDPNSKFSVEDWHFTVERIMP